MNKFYVGFNGILIFAIGAILMGHAIDSFNTKETIGFVGMVIGICISGYYLAMPKE